MNELPEVRHLPPDHLAALNAHTDSLFIITEFFRPGAPEALQAIEDDLFTPGTSLNNRFVLMFTHWHELPWCIAQMPWVAKPDVERILARMGMRLQDGTPHVVNGPKSQQTGRLELDPFPLKSRFAFQLGTTGGPAVRMGSFQAETPEDFKERIRRAARAAAPTWRERN